MKTYDYKTELIYEEYMCIAHDAYHEKIRYYESHLDQIVKMPFERRTEIRLDYAFSLFNVGAYEQYILKSDSLVKLVISENIYEFRGKDVYRELLFMKAVSHYRIQEHDIAKHIFSALLKMSPQHEEYIKAYQKCLRDDFRDKSQFLRGLSIIVFLLLGVVVAADLLLVRSFYPSLLTVVNLIKSVLLILGLALIVYNEWDIRHRANRARL